MNKYELAEILKDDTIAKMKRRKIKEDSEYIRNIFRC